MASKADLLNGRDHGPGDTAAAPAAADALAAKDFPFGPPPPLSPDTPFNPFRNHSHAMPPVLEALHLAAVLPLFLLRVALLLTMFACGYIATKLALVGARHSLSKPFPAWRRACLWPVRLCARGVLFACGYHWIRVAGAPAPREAAPILVCNHVTFVDPVFIFFAHLPMIVAAKENLAIPVAGVIMKALQVIAVDRSSAASRRGAAGEIRRRALCNDWGHVAIFPEATTTNGRALVGFKAGAFATPLPVQPITVKYRFRRADPSWVAEGPPIHALLFRLMTQWHNYMEVTYLPVLEPGSGADARQLAGRCRAAMARSLGVGTTEHTYGDVALALEAQRLRLPPGAANVEFGRFEHNFRLENKEARGFLRTWAAIDLTRRGTVTCEELAAYLNVPDAAPPVRRAFTAVFDPRGRGSITFREFLHGVAFVLTHPRFADATDAAFALFDANGDGLITPDEGPPRLRALLPGTVPEQVEAAFAAMDLNRQGAVASNEFAEYMRLHPEFLAVLLAAEPSLAGGPPPTGGAAA